MMPSVRLPAVPSMRVALATVGQHVNIWLRFGAPQRIFRLDAYRRQAVFLSGAVCCRVSWAANDYGTVHWRVMVLQAGAQRDVIQRIAGVTPGARILLSAENERRVKAVLAIVDAIEALGISPLHVSTAYWRVVNDRLAARLVPPAYTAERHAAHLARSALIH